MRLRLIIVVLVMPFVHGTAQDFAPQGAEWYYNESSAFGPYLHYYYLQVEGDTTIQDKECRTINLNGSPCVTYAGMQLHVYDSMDVVYYFNPYLESFHILYDFNLEAGESWTTINSPGYEIDTMTVTVDSVALVDVNGSRLKALYVEYDYIREDFEYTYNSIIYERIGDLSFLFNYYSGYVICRDHTYYIGLRCYNDDVIGNYETGIVDSCDQLITNSIDLESDVELNFYPNPFTDHIRLETSYQGELSMVIYDAAGQSWLSRTIYPNDRIPLEFLPAGVYYLSVFNDHTYKTLIQVRH